jgi:hypothetical protein
VTLVDVPDGRREPERAHGANAADAEHGLLAEAVITVAAVENVGDSPIFRRVLLDVGVEQQHRHAADGRAPDAQRDVATRERAGHAELAARAVERDRERRRARLDRGVLGELLAVAVDPLVEVPLPVEQSDRDERQLQVARGLAVVAREHA